MNRHTRSNGHARLRSGATSAVGLAMFALALAGQVRTQNSWQLIPQVTPQSRSSVGFAFDAPRDRLVVFDGRETWESDGAGWTLISARTPTLRFGSRLVFDPTRGRVISFGGSDLSSNANGSTWEWDGAEWTAIASSGPSARRDYAMALDVTRGRVVLHGGVERSNLLRDTWEWDGSQWVQVATTAPSFRAAHAMAFDEARGRMVLYGGRSGSVNVNDTWEWDGSTWTRGSVPGPAGSSTHDLVYDPVGRRVLMSGLPTAGGTWAWDGTSWNQVATDASRPRARLVTDTMRSRVLAYGGSGWRDDTSVWTGSGWAELLPQTQPNENLEGSMVFDPATQSLLLFGGQPFPIREYTWSWDGVRWTRVATSGPSASSGAAMIGDLARQRVVLFGGIDQSGTPLDETWEWDGTSWTERVTNNPPPRTATAMAYDSARGRVVMFGGQATSGPLGDTWEWDGTSWLNVSTTGPQPQVRHLMAYDETRGRTVLVNAAGSETWEWDGSVWTRVVSATSPFLLFGQATFDANRGRVVTIDTFSNLQEFDGAQWSPIPGFGRVDRTLLSFDRARNRLVAFGGGSSLQQTIARVREWMPITDIGAGCAGDRGAPRLASLATLPRVGASFVTNVDSLPFGAAPVFGMLGFTRPSSPIDLDALGMPTCALRLDVTLSLPLPRTTTEATWTTSIPGTASLVGLQFFQQAFVVDPFANAFGATLSNAVSAIVE